MTFHFLRLMFTAAVVLLGFAASAQAADPIAGKWKRPNGIIVQFSPCGAGFCASPLPGPNAGKDKGTLTDLEKNKTYTGKGSISGSTLTVSGCVLAILCRSESWTRQ
jgi:uncharacterized protein (DUF2147 family)